MDALHCLSSMATRALLQTLCARWTDSIGQVVRPESVGGVNAARRIEAGESADVVVLADDALKALSAAGRVGAITPVALSGVSIAAPTGPTPPSVRTIAELQKTLQASRAIGYSTGPSGKALLAMFEQWGLLGAMKDRLVQAPPGVPVGALLAQGAVDLGFQQHSELVHQAGIVLLGPMPPGAEIVTTFSAARCLAGGKPEQSAAFIAYLASPACGDAIRHEGMTPASGPSNHP
ncbi:MAG: substrate-binding domain-containing protein [Xylophilus ampelinus]